MKPVRSISNSKRLGGVCTDFQRVAGAKESWTTGHPGYHNTLSYSSSRSEFRQHNRNFVQNGSTHVYTGNEQENKLKHTTTIEGKKNGGRKNQ